MPFELTEPPPGAEWIVPSLIEASPAFEWLDLAGDIIVPLLSTLVGAAIAIFVAKLAAREAADLATQGRITAEKSQWYILMHKSATILSDLDSINRWVVESLSRSNEAGLTSQRLWQRLGGLAGGSVTIDLNPAEFIPLIEAEEYDLIAEFNYIVGQHQTIAAATVTYSQRRSELGERIKQSQTTGSSMLLSALSNADLRALEPHMTELDTLAANIRDRTPLVMARAHRLILDLGPAGQKYFRDPHFRSMKIVDLES